MRTSSPGAEGRSQRGEAGRLVAPSPEPGYPGPPRPAPAPARAHRWSSGNSAPAALPGRALSLRGSRGPRRPRFRRVSRAETGAAPAPDRRGRGLAARPTAPQVLFRPRLCWQLPAARGRAR